MEQELVNQVTSVIPQQWAGYASLATVALMIAGRMWHGLRNGGGVVGMWKAFLYGTNTPKQ